jgi:hypothetical protein
MQNFAISNTPSQKDYRGCGKAWAAIKNNVPVALRYMGQFSFDPSKAPAWVLAVYESYSTIHEPSSRIDYISSRELGKIKKAAVSAGYPEFGPRGGHIKASAVAREARSILQKLEKEQFADYRNSSREELRRLGDVASGMCSCREFVTNVQPARI